MDRTLIIIPKMFNQEEFRMLTGIIPDDFEKTSKEFWDYIEEKLVPLIHTIKRVYCIVPLEIITKHIKSSENGEYLIFRKLIENNSELIYVEDKLLVSEVEGWLEMMKTTKTAGVIELYEDSVKERNNYIIKKIDQTLKVGEIGVMITNLNHKLPLPEDIRLIKMCRFNPEDYLTRWVTKLELEKQVSKE